MLLDRLPALIKHSSMGGQFPNRKFYLWPAFNTDADASAHGDQSGRRFFEARRAAFNIMRDRRLFVRREFSGDDWIRDGG
jgi:hypothetical protein